MWTEENSEEYGDGFLYHMLYDAIDEEVVRQLQKCRYYQKWQEELTQITKKHPHFESLMMNGNGTVSMSEEEHKAFVRYCELTNNMQSAQKQKCYYVGQIHAAIIQKDLAGRMGGTAWKHCRRCKCGGRSTVSENQDGDLLKKFFITLGKEREKNLAQYPEYQKLRKKEEKLLKKQPFIQQLIEGDHTDEELKLSHDQQQALTNFFALQKRKGTFETLETVLIGCRAGMT